MPNSRSRPGHRALWLGALVVVVLAGMAYAAGRLTASPSAVANIDVFEVFEKLTQRADMEVEIAAKKRAFDDELRKRSQALDEQVKGLESLPVDQQLARLDDLNLAKLQLREWGTMEAGGIDVEEALQWQNLYRSVQQEAARLATEEGYDYVLVYDGPASIVRDRTSQAPQAQQVMDQVMRRRVLYGAEKDDITDRLIIRMNNARSAK